LYTRHEPQRICTWRKHGEQWIIPRGAGKVITEAESTNKATFSKKKRQEAAHSQQSTRSFCHKTEVLSGKNHLIHLILHQPTSSFPYSENCPHTMMISGHHRHLEECNCWIKCSSFTCLYQWLLCANFIKAQKVCCSQRTGFWTKIKCLLISLSTCSYRSGPRMLLFDSMLLHETCNITRFCMRNHTYKKIWFYIIRMLMFCI